MSEKHFNLILAQNYTLEYVSFHVYKVAENVDTLSIKMLAVGLLLVLLNTVSGEQISYDINVQCSFKRI